MPQNGQGVGSVERRGWDPKIVETGTETSPRATSREDTRSIMGPFKDILQGENLLFLFSFGRRQADFEDIARSPLSNILSPHPPPTERRTVPVFPEATENELSVTLSGESTVVVGADREYMGTVRALAQMG